MSVNIGVADMFKTPTIAGLAGTIKEKEPGVFIRIEPGEEREYYDLSNAQRRLWVLHQFPNARYSYNMPAAFTIEGELDINALNRALRVLSQRHESLRTGFITVNGLPRQRVYKKIDFALTVNEIAPPGDAADSDDVIRRQIDRLAGQNTETVFHLARPPLFKAELVKLPGSRYILLLNMHHIISDGWSMTIFFKELAALYNTRATPHHLLPRLRIQYRDYARWQPGFQPGQEAKRILAPPLSRGRRNTCPGPPRGLPAPRG